MPATKPATMEKIIAAAIDEVFDIIKKKIAKPTPVTRMVASAIKPKYASKVILMAALEILSCRLFSSLTREAGTSFEALRQRESSRLFVF